MRILALDPSSTHVGWCFGIDQDIRTSGCFDPPDKTPLTRLRSIWAWADETIAQVKPEILAYEEPAGNHGNRKTDRLLANVTGVILAAGFRHGIYRVSRIFPMQVKATKAYKGGPDNLGPRRIAAAAVGKRMVGPDEADAIGVYLATLHKLGHQVGGK